MRTGEESAAAPTRALGGSAGGVPPYIWTACTNAGCSAYGVRRQIWLKQIAVGVIALPGTLLCAACTCCLPLSIYRPFDEIEEEPMPKIHNGRGPTDRNDIPAPTTAPEPASAPVEDSTQELAPAAEPVADVAVGEPGPELAAKDEPVAESASAESTLDLKPAEGTADVLPPASDEEREHPGTNVPKVAAEAPAESTIAAPDAVEKPKTAPRKTAGRKAGGKN